MPDTKSDKVREFIKKLPKGKFVTDKMIAEKFMLARPTTYHLMHHIVNEQKLSSRLEMQDSDDGRKHLVRIYYKP